MTCLRAIVLLYFCLCWPQQAFATPCGTNAAKALQDFPIAMKVFAHDRDKNYLAAALPWLFDGPDSTTTFTVLAMYKGAPETRISVSHFAQSDTHENIYFTKDREYLIFPSRDDDGGYRIDSCTRVYDADAGTPAAVALDDAAAALDKITARLSQAHEKARQDLASAAAAPQSAAAAANLRRQYYNGTTCDTQYPDMPAYPAFLRPFPPPSPPEFYIIQRHELADYAQAVFRFGAYGEALRALCLSGVQTPSATLLRFLSRARLGLPQAKQDILSFAATEAADVDIAGAAVGAANFSGARLVRLNAPQALLQRADFSRATLSGNLRGANLAEADLSGADVTAADLTDANLTDANLRGVDFSANITAKMLPTIKLDGAIADETTLWPTGFVPTGRGIRLQGALDPSAPAEPEMFPPGDSEKSVLRVVRGGIYDLDGVHIRQYNRVQFDNSQKNVIRVQSASLVGRSYRYSIGQNKTQKYDAFKNVRIEGDRGLDIVVLDGCFEWESPPEMTSGTSYSTVGGPLRSVSLQKYKASATAGQPVEVLVEKGLKVAFSKSCMSATVASAPAPAPRPAMRGLESPNAVGLLQAKVFSLERYWARNDPPNLIDLPPAGAPSPSCPSGERVYATSGVFTLEGIPAGCGRVLVKMWGAGGGGAYGGPGGFTAGLVDVPARAEFKVIVGGSGVHGRGGFNGGGDPGTGDADRRSGGGGGGRSEIIVDGRVVAVAGGGGGTSGRGGAAFPGGGRYRADAEEAYFRSRSVNVIGGSAGEGGHGGRAQPARGNCAAASDGGVKDGGSGAPKTCGQQGGGGGGGHGGGAGGGENASGFGGGGMAPEFGLTVWGRSGGGLPANVSDLHHSANAGRAGQAGLVAVIWPAPSPEEFLSAIVSHETDKTPFVRDDAPKSPSIVPRVAPAVTPAPVVTERPPAPLTPVAKIEPYLPDTTANIARYRAWAEAIPNARIRRALGILVNVMENKAFPTEFAAGTVGPQGKVLRALVFDPMLQAVTPAKGSLDCEQEGKTASGFPPLVVAEEALEASCGGDTMIFSGSGDDKITIPTGSFGLLAPGGGKDTLTVEGRAIIVLEKDWGLKSITRQCSVPDATPRFYTRKIKPFGGVGAKIMTGGKALVMSVMSGMPAGRSGLRAGDEIIRIDGRRVESSSQATDWLRGLPGSSVKVDVLRGGAEHSINIQRALVQFSSSDIHDLQRVDYNAEFPFDSFIVFGPGVSPGDLNSADGREWTDRSTGATLSVSPCINFIFTDESVTDRRLRVASVVHALQLGAAASQAVPAGTPTALPPAPDRAKCPVGWGMSQRPLVASPPGKYNALLAPDEQHYANNITHRVDGAGGRDTLKLPGSGYADFDGQQVKSLEVIEAANDSSNIFNLLGPGLVELEDRNITINGDKDIDIAYLDGCLSWQGPIVGPNGALRYVARDMVDKGKMATLDLTDGVQVKFLPPVRIADWLAAMPPVQLETQQFPVEARSRVREAIAEASVFPIPPPATGPVLLTRASSDNRPSCPAAPATAADAFLRYPVVLLGSFGKDGVFQHEKVYKGYRNWPIPFAKDGLPSKVSAAGGKFLVLADYGPDGASTRCGAVLDENGKLSSISFAALVAEAAVYDATVSVRMAEKTGNERQNSQGRERLPEFLASHGDPLAVIEAAAVSMRLDAEKLAERPGRGDIEMWERQRIAESRPHCLAGAPNGLLTPDILFTIQSLQNSTRAQHNAVPALRDFGKALISVGAFDDAMYTLCGIGDDSSYLIAAVKAGRRTEMKNARELRVYNLAGVNLAGLQLQGGRFEGKWTAVDASGADFTNARFNNTDLADVRLDGARMDFASYTCKTKFPAGFDPVAAHMVPQWRHNGCDKEPLPSVDLRITSTPETGIKLWHIDLNGVAAQRAALGIISCDSCITTKSDFTGVRMTWDGGGKFSDTSFAGADLRQSNFSNGTLTRVNFAGAKLAECDFNGTTLLSVDFRQADLAGARFRGAKYDAGTLFPVGFDPVTAGMDKVRD